MENRKGCAMSDENARPQFGRLSFYEAMADVLNHDPVWGEKARSITCSMLHIYGSPVDRTFYTNFEEGRVTEVAELPAGDDRTTDFVITGIGDSWKAVLRKEVKPTTAMASGKLKVDGKQIYLLRNMSAFSHMLDLMTNLDPAYD